MKYIRTKDGRIYEIETKEYGGIRKGCFKNASDNFNLHYSLREWQLDCKNQYCLDTPNGHTVCEKQADTIEELCDSYVITSKQGHIYDTYGDYNYELEQVLPQARIEEPDEDWDLYGCILVNGIIKQVAKFNDEKGELELL